ncbi:MAG TPA: hypothetical protein VLH40_07510 [Atribacteraceae bacterium]|nr:hypothetical protein [Atribacteraceae bacterium]
MVVLFFALYNVNFQLNALGMWTFRDPGFRSRVAMRTSVDGEMVHDLPPVIDGKQVITMETSAFGYTLNFFRV